MKTDVFEKEINQSYQANYDFYSLIVNVMSKVLVALRDVGDLHLVSSYLRNRGERPHLTIAYLKLSQDSAGKFAVRFGTPTVDRANCAKTLKGFDFDLIALDYDGDRLPASVYSDEAVRRHCDSMLVVSDSKKLYFSANLASTLAVESSIPLIVIKS